MKVEFCKVTMPDSVACVSGSLPPVAFEPYFKYAKTALVYLELIIILILPLHVNVVIETVQFKLVVELCCRIYVTW